LAISVSRSQAGDDTPADAATIEPCPKGKVKPLSRLSSRDLHPVPRSRLGLEHSSSEWQM
jgi:hypothetical protein